MINIPSWRQTPEQVFLKCLAVAKAPNEREYVVQFETSLGKFTAFVPNQYVNVEGKYISAAIIADVEDGILVDIPVETLTSGPRFLIKDSEKEELLNFHAVGGGNGIK